MLIQDLYKISIDSSSYDRRLSLSRDYLTTLKGSLASKKTIKVLTGIRRSGKSYLLKQLADLAKDLVPQQNILFISFEHDELVADNLVNLASLREMYQLFLSHVDLTKEKYLFLDEIQNVEGWESFVRTIYDSEAANIFITGSNSKLLSSEFSTALGGRVLEFFIQPYSFSEVLKKNKIDCSSTFALAQNKEAIVRSFDQYLLFGGFPEVLELAEPLKIQYKKSLVEKIILNDILPRFSGMQARVFVLLADYFERTSSTIWSAKNLAAVTKLSVTSVYEYVSSLTSSYLYTELPKYSYKSKALFARQAKITCLDPILALRADISQKLEVIVYSELVRRFSTTSVFFGRDEKAREIDFLVLNVPNKKNCAIQVVYELNHKNLKRELSPLILAKEYQSAEEFIIIAQQVKNIDHKTIPTWIKLMSPIEFLLSVDLI